MKAPHYDLMAVLARDLGLIREEEIKPFWPVPTGDAERDWMRQQFAMWIRRRGRHPGAAAQARKYGADRPMRLPPADLTLGQIYYTIQLADDELGSNTGVPSCAVCNAIADAGSFALRDAVAQVDQMLEAAGGPGDMDVERLGEDAPFPTEADIANMGVKDLTAAGILMPPFHPNCRCSIVEV